MTRKYKILKEYPPTKGKGDLATWTFIQQYEFLIWLTYVYRDNLYIWSVLSCGLISFNLQKFRVFAINLVMILEWR